VLKFGLKDHERHYSLDIRRVILFDVLNKLTFYLLTYLLTKIIGSVYLR